MTLALALADVEEPDEARMGEIDADAPTPVPRARFSETHDFPMYDAKKQQNSPHTGA